jgi:selenocysteine lyase/cysteine desulfurase
VSEAIDRLAIPLRAHYRRFLAGAGGEILLTGHSHQAWPDVAREAQLEAWDDAASLADRKWDRVFGQVLPEFRAAVARRIGGRRPGDLALATNTHELVVRLASCFPPTAGVVTTDQEFHSLRRQLGRMEEDGAAITRVEVGDGRAIGARFAEALEKHRPAWAALSLVTFTTSTVVDDLQVVLQTAARLGVPVLVDAYHAFNAMPLSVEDWPGQVFVVGGGYKYAQGGEGACWMLLPRDAGAYRPRATGWFADFAHLEAPPAGPTPYAAGGDRFFGATFEPTAFYRGRRVFAWMDAQGLGPEVLRAHSLAQTQRIIDGARARGLFARGLELASPQEPARRGAFVAFRHAEPGALVERLEAAAVRTDARRPFLRLGPAPYTTSAEIDRALDALAGAV